jgi:hypothetical protein
MAGLFALDRARRDAFDSREDTAMKHSPLTLAAAAFLTFGLTHAASADPDKQKGERETQADHHAVDEAITAASAAADTWSKQLGDALDATRKDGKTRETEIRSQMSDLVNALARLRKGFDDDTSWTDQRKDARIAYSRWHSLDPMVRKHWASDTRDAFEVLHRALRELARIYEVDAPAR